MNKIALKESAKELARVAVLGAAAAVISYFSTQVANLDPNSAYAVVLTVVLRIADRYVHVSPNNNAKGLVPF